MTLESDIRIMAVSISTGVVVLTLLVSHSTAFRTLLWYIFTRLSTSFFVHTGLYRNVYLGFDLSNDKMYEHAVTATETLKVKEKGKFVHTRRIKKEKTQAREQEDGKLVKNPAQNRPGPTHLFKFRVRPHHEAGVDGSSGDIVQEA